MSTDVPFSDRTVEKGGSAISGSPLRTVPVRINGVFPCLEAKYAKKLVKKTRRAFLAVAISHKDPLNNLRL